MSMQGVELYGITAAHAVPLVLLAVTWNGEELLNNHYHINGIPADPRKPYLPH